MKRRHVIAGAGSIGLASLAGCLGLAGLDAHEASPAGVDPAVRDDTGYEQTEVDDLRIEEEVGVSAASEEIVVTNYLTEHEKAVDMGPLGEQRGAEFTILSTPKVGVAGQNFNPVEDKSAAELVELIAGNYDAVGDVEHVSDDEVTILEQSTTMSTFVADAEFEGQSVDVNLHVTEAVETDDDLLVTIGVYPERLEGQEEPNVRSLVEHVLEDVEDAGEQNGGEEGEDGEDDEEADESDDEAGDDADEGDGSNDEDGEDDEDDGIV
ncbi:hypothetical protein CV102_12325 [Natronococcus pandeyae]|uniref:Uncharacterized protein n=1 Tax=Natronococcus pandeyae TaxID=2055836 RepID=A0A8J8Q1A6_9EURY|nr:DUF6517 family protein [Natronococcus pandeyae]TYL38576.1 hypothetical protein CV102_12325 [Natronococcus pandeyae]